METYKTYTKEEIEGYNRRKFFWLVAGYLATVVGICFLLRGGIRANIFLFAVVSFAVVAIILFTEQYLRFMASLRLIQNVFILNEGGDVIAYHRTPLYASSKELSKIGARIVRHSLDPFCVSRTITTVVSQDAFLRVFVQARIGVDETNLQQYADLFVSHGAIPNVTPEKSSSAIMENFLRAIRKRICEMYLCGHFDDDIRKALQKSIEFELAKCSLVLLSLSVTTQAQEFIIE